MPDVDNMWTMQAMAYLEPRKDGKLKDDPKDFRPSKFMDMRYEKDDKTKRPRPESWYDFNLDEELDEEYACVYFNPQRNQAYVALKGELSVSTIK